MKNSKSNKTNQYNNYLQKKVIVKGSLQNKEDKQGACLYVVATPIGNLKDITFRAVETLNYVDFIACEDTRVTLKLLNHYGIKAKMINYNDHSTQVDRDKIINLLLEGNNIALVSDAGTPLISDPGYKLVSQARQRNIEVIPIPGPSSIISAISVSDLPTDRFSFLGFLPPEEKAQAKYIEAIKNIPITLVLLESPNRLTKTLNILHEKLGNRNAMVARELTKIYEEITSGSLTELIEKFEAKSVKGEIVILIAGSKEKTPTEEEISRALEELLLSHTLKSAVEEVASSFNIPKKLAYSIALQIKELNKTK